MDTLSEIILRKIREIRESLEREVIVISDDENAVIVISDDEDEVIAISDDDDDIENEVFIDSEDERETEKQE